MRKPLTLLLWATLCSGPPVLAQAKPADEFWKACRNGDVASVRKFLDSGMDANTRFDAGITPIGAAAARGQAEVVKLLLERGADPNLRDDTFKLTPITTAFFFGHPQLVPLLLPTAKEDMDVLLRFGAMMGVLPVVEAALKGNVQPHDKAIAWTLAKAGDKKEVLAALEKAGVTAPPAVAASDLPHFVGQFRDATKLELEVVLRDGKLFATGGSGFSEFFDSEALAAGPHLLFLKSNPGTVFRFEGAGGSYSRVSMIVPGSTHVLQRSAGGSK